MHPNCLAVDAILTEAGVIGRVQILSRAHRVDTAKAAALVGTAKLSRATPEFVYETTGQRIGGTAPVGRNRSGQPAAPNKTTRRQDQDSWRAPVPAFTHDRQPATGCTLSPPRYAVAAG